MPGSEGTTDHFPSTHATWLAERVTLSLDPGASPARARAARDELNAHVMSRYFEPLCAYVRATDDELEELTLGVASGRIPKQEVIRFFGKRLRKSRGARGARVRDSSGTRRGEDRRKA